jgi:hypothetical protein
MGVMQTRCRMNEWMNEVWKKNFSLTTRIRETTFTRIPRKMILQKLDMNVWIGLTRLWNGPGGGLFWTQQWIGHTEGNSFHDQLRVTELHRRWIHLSYLPTLPGRFYMYLFKISNSGLWYDQPKDSGGRVCLKSIHLSKYVNLAADRHLATGVVQDSAQKWVFTADQRSARKRHLYIRHSSLYPKT